MLLDDFLNKILQLPRQVVNSQCQATAAVYKLGSQESVEERSSACSAVHASEAFAKEHSSSDLALQTCSNLTWLYKSC